MLTYKGFVAQLEYDPEADCIVGEVVNAQDVLIFEGKDLEQLKQHFANLIDEYLELCQSQKQPDSVSPFVGRFTICLSPDDQIRLFRAAEREAVGVNHWLNREVQFLIKRLSS